MSEPVDPPPGTAASDILEDRIWVDGCFEFFNHGHAGALVKARQMGTELYVGIHSDEEILKNKGPTVMNLEERYELDGLIVNLLRELCTNFGFDGL